MEIDWDSDLGIFLRRDSIALGYDDRRLRAMVRAGVLHKIRHGAYIPTETWRVLDASGRHRVTARAVLRTAHPTAVLSHVSAILEHEAPTWNVDLSVVHLTRTDGVAGRREAGVVHHCGGLPESDVRLRHLLPVTTPGRALIELTSHASVESSLVSTNWLLNQGATSPAELEGLVQRFRHWPGTLTSDLAVRLANGRNAWPGEARLSHLLWREHLPKTAPQYEIYDETGRLVAVLDFALPDFGVFIEFDGVIKYERLRREGETLSDVILREKRREELVCLLTGWICVRVTWEDLSRPTLTARRIRAILASRVTR
jgi:hypothetical protein